ncbi:hypothetical protein KS4_30120 [Poriferisphaera corsica]|uniref:Uncharacterized protein n=1 Tax=Poriferisphaera corsica TaxID=2528020 RepID=A0A517YXI5_9BACT|nr:hypothetical protein [Poriferisphaera corsica]QDU34935.1 hypothetical protein KS4_30120 [Poriferisphaera corsica]
MRQKPERYVLGTGVLMLSLVMGMTGSVWGQTEGKSEKDVVKQRMNHLQKRVYQLEDEVDELQMQLTMMEELESKLANLQAEMAHLQLSVHDRGDLVKGEGADGKKNAKSGANLVEEPTYRYKYDLVFDRQREKVRYRDDDGDLHERWRTVTDRSKVGVRMFVINDEDFPIRLELEVQVLRNSRTNVNPDSRRVLGTGVVSTPLLEPGEIHEVTKWIHVDDALRVKQADVVGAKGYRTPQLQR